MHVLQTVLIREGSRATCPVITTTGVAVVLYRVREKVFCSAANSTAYRFPMNDARIFDGPEGPAAECPLDGTTYDLQTGKVPSHRYRTVDAIDCVQVLEWCPKSNPLRAVLGTLKVKTIGLCVLSSHGMRARTVERRSETAFCVRCGRGRRWGHFYKAFLTGNWNLESR